MAPILRLETKQEAYDVSDASPEVELFGLEKPLI